MIWTLTLAWITQYVSGLKDWILSCRSTQKPSVGVWHGPNEIREESRFPYFPWKYLVWNLNEGMRMVYERGLNERQVILRSKKAENFSITNVSGIDGWFFFFLPFLNIRQATVRNNQRLFFFFFTDQRAHLLGFYWLIRPYYVYVGHSVHFLVLKVYNISR